MPVLWSSRFPTPKAQGVPIASGMKPKEALIRITIKRHHGNGIHTVAGAVSRRGHVLAMGRQRCGPFSRPLETEA